VPSNAPCRLPGRLPCRLPCRGKEEVIAAAARARRTSASTIRATAQEHFGHDRLLPGQEEAIRALVDGRDVLLVAPTGAGKSLTYQVAGLLTGGCTVVVSPLLALSRTRSRRWGTQGSQRLG